MHIIIGSFGKAPIKVMPGPGPGFNQFIWHVFCGKPLSKPHPAFSNINMDLAQGRHPKKLSFKFVIRILSLSVAISVKPPYQIHILLVGLKQREHHPTSHQSCQSKQYRKCGQ